MAEINKKKIIKKIEIPELCPNCKAKIELTILPVKLFHGNLGVECPVCRWAILFT